MGRVRQSNIDGGMSGRKGERLTGGGGGNTRERLVTSDFVGGLGFVNGMY